MAESAVLPLLAEAAKPMIGVLVSRVTAEIQLCRDFKRDLSELQRKIQIISSTVLNMTSATNTRSSSSSSNTMELWVRDVVNIVHNVEDLLDVLAYEKQRQVVMKRTFLWPLKQVYFRRKISRWIKRINTITGEALIEAQTIIQLKDLVHSTSPLPTATNFITNEGAAAAAENRLQQLRRYVDISLIVGRDSDVDSVVDKLCNPSKDCYNTSNNCLSVVAVVGIGGIGKTVLAKKGSPGGLLKHVKYLRVLDLCDMGLEEVPESVAGLKCLKSLSLAANPIKVLPEFVTELYNLQSLNLLKCDLLKEVPGGLSNLVNLRHLMIKILNLPAGMIGQLRCLQTLPPLWVNEGGFQISELGDLPHVSGSLAIHGLEHINSKQDAESASLSEKSRVKKLRLLWDSDDDWIKHKEVLDGLKPKSNLRYLIICGYGGEIFPSWLMRMDVIKIIELVGCRRCQKLPTLGHLPFLEKLLIEDMESLECIGEELHCNTAILTEVKSSMVYFPSLKQLRLIGLHKLTEWVEPSSGGWTLFPLLEELKMAYCHELTTTPNTFPSLKQLTVTNITSGRPLSNIITNKSSVKCLKVLQLDWITDITDLPEYLAESCKSLQTLKIGNCVNLSFLPENLSMLISLQVLEIKRCDKLVSIPNLSNLGSLRELMIFHNLALTSVPKGLQSCNSLERLWFACCPKVETLPDLTGLTRLCNLSIRSMTKMITQPPDWLYTLPCLRLLGIGSYWELDEVPDMSFLVKIVSLESLHLFGWEKLQSLPEQLQQFTTLKELGICDCDNMEYLPDWVGNLSSLRYLSPTRCRNLKRLPTMDAMKRLTKLSFLKIEDCPELEEAVQFNGSEYHKISHIEIKIVYPTY
ncbi:hypothetical protein SOVF_028080 [Spinacia oleracea]|nr:hypothetical protein SOVF_028080 [Spinacia oleracea]